MLDPVALQPPARSLRTLAAFVLAALALAPLARAPVSRTHCERATTPQWTPATTMSPAPDHPRATLHRRTPGLNLEYLQRELR